MTRTSTMIIFTRIFKLHLEPNCFAVVMDWNPETVVFMVVATAYMISTVLKYPVNQVCS